MGFPLPCWLCRRASSAFCDSINDWILVGIGTTGIWDDWPWQRLYFSPLPHGQGSLRPIFLFPRLVIAMPSGDNMLTSAAGTVLGRLAYLMGPSGLKQRGGRGRAILLVIQAP